MNLHPLLDNGIKKGSDSFKGGTLKCKCPTDQVVVKIGSQVLHNHACGCTMCWKPAGASMSIVGVVPSGDVKVTAHASKLKVVDANATILRHACQGCAAHMYGPVEKDHAFKGLSFIHSELFEENGAAEPTFAAFVSSMIEGGTPPAKMTELRKRLADLKLPYYDSLSPGLMDALATFAAKKSGALKS